MKQTRPQVNIYLYLCECFYGYKDNANQRQTKMICVIIVYYES